MQTVPAGQIVWQPTREDIDNARLTDFVRASTPLEKIGPDSYDALWQRSVEEPGEFWNRIVEYFGIEMSGGWDRAVSGTVENPSWFEGAYLNYADEVVRQVSGLTEVLVAVDESGNRRSLSGTELVVAVAEVAAALRAWGVKSGDVVASYLPNVPETVIAFLATAAVGAVWTNCSPEFGATSVLDRFDQVQPTVLFATRGYRHRGRWYDRTDTVQRIVSGLPTLRQTVIVGESDEIEISTPVVRWREIATGNMDRELVTTPVPFDHPLWILYSSGTTGTPKALVHSHGGIVLEHSKLCGLQLDLGRGDRFLWYTTTGWVMWNILVGALLAQATIVLFDGDITHPSPDEVWKLAAQEKLTFVGLSAGHIHQALEAGLDPGHDHDLGSLRAVGATGSPLSPEGYVWVRDHLGERVVVHSISGGTDVATAFLAGAPILPVHAGELQRPALGADVAAYDGSGQPTVGTVGELVVRSPMPSMPVQLWGDADGSRRHDTYFSTFPGVWRHGDWVTKTSRGTFIVHGRSDATLNRGGVRMGTSEFYRVLDTIDGVEDSLIVDTGTIDHPGALVLFVAVKEPQHFNEEDSLRARIRSELSPRHIPDEIYAVRAIPRTLNGKRMEVPVKKMLQGARPAEVASRASMANPETMDAIARVARRRRDTEGATG